MSTASFNRPGDVVMHAEPAGEHSGIRMKSATQRSRRQAMADLGALVAVAGVATPLFADPGSKRKDKKEEPGERILRALDLLQEASDELIRLALAEELPSEVLAVREANVRTYAAAFELSINTGRATFTELSSEELTQLDLDVTRFCIRERLRAAIDGTPG